MIFVSYRREDTLAVVGRMTDRLIYAFGADKVFVDIDSIPVGTNFDDHIKSALRECRIVLAIVGTDWLGRKRKQTGMARIHCDGDFVRKEVGLAFEMGIPIIPVLVNGAKMPTKAQLPEAISEFSLLNAAELDIGSDFNSDISKLIRAIERIIEDSISVMDRKLRQLISQLRTDSVDYDDIEPALALSIEKQLPQCLDELVNLGDVKETVYKGSQQGMEVFDVRFERGSLTWLISLSRNARVAGLFYMHQEPIGWEKKVRIENRV